MFLELLLAGAILVSLTWYVLLGGADYGAGVWSALAVGPRAGLQREALAKAIGPIWEANHVWLILVITLLFTAFPTAFAAVSVRFHIPLVLMLIGIVLRGSAFAFRTNDVVPKTALDVGAQRFWERIFAVSSVFTPLMLGTVIGAVTSGYAMKRDATFLDVFVRPWATPFCFTVGALAMVLFALLAAVYLLQELEDGALREDFRTRALWAGGVASVLAVGAFLLAKDAAPRLPYALTHTAWGALVLAMVGVSATGAWIALWRRTYRAALPFAVGEVVLIVWGWGLAQYPYLVAPDVTLRQGAPHQTLEVVLAALVVGAVVLFPSLYYLYRIFKGQTLRPPGRSGK